MKSTSPLFPLFLAVSASAIALGAQPNPISVPTTGADSVAAGMKDVDKSSLDVGAAIRRDLAKAAFARKTKLAQKEEEFFQQFKSERNRAIEKAKSDLDTASNAASVEESAVRSAERDARNAARKVEAARKAASAKDAPASAKTNEAAAEKDMKDKEKALAAARAKLEQAKKTEREAAANYEKARKSAKEARADARKEAKKYDSSLPAVKIAEGEDWLRETVVDGISLFDTLNGLSAVYGGDLSKAAAEVQKLARENGFYIASVKAESGAVKADPGVFGPVKIEFADGVSGAGWRYSESQISNRIARAGVSAGEPFNYNRLYQAFYKINGEPDVAADVYLDPPTDENSRELGARFKVTKDELPFHAVLGIDNYGTDSSGEWIARGTFQFLNLWQADHAFTVNALSSLKSDERLVGGAASYYVPLREGLFRRHDAALTFHGGFTDVDTDEVVPAIDVEGRGWFAGVQGSIELCPDWNDSLRLAVGATYRSIWDRLVVQDGPGERKFPLAKTEVDIVPLSVSLLYTGAVDDWFDCRGRNYATLEVVANFGGSSDEEVQRQRAAAERDYVVAHMQLARLQTIGGQRALDESGRLKSISGSHMVFVKVDSQIANGAVVSAEQMGIGGANSVRGYKEREFLGDHAVTATLEYRTPLLLNGIGSLFDADWSDRLQFVAFCDMGWIGIEDALPGEDDSEFLASLGAGIRAAWSDWSLLRLDYGVPLKETSESDHSGRLHLSVQAQF